MALSLASATLIFGCARSTDDSPANQEERGELLVFAAASLTDAFNDIKVAFEAAHPHIETEINFAGSQSLRTQIENGALPQVFASANATHLDSLAAKGLVGSPAVFAYNSMVIAVPANNPAGVRSLENLADAERVVLAGANVPAGAYADEVIAKAAARYGATYATQVERRIVSRENHVRQTLQKVVLGEADAALVYATDARAAGDKVIAIPIPEDLGVRAAYPIAVVKAAPRGALARQFVDFVLSEPGAAILHRHGFRTMAR